MGIQINGSNDTISAADGGLSLSGSVSYEDVTNVTSVGLSTFSSGIHIDDSITHLGDTNTKIRFPAADTITAETAGSERVRITSAGNFGIGDASPARPLSVSSNQISARFTSSSTDSQIEVIDSSGTVVYGSASGNAIVQAGGAERVRIDSSGNMGLGTISPASLGSGFTEVMISGNTEGAGLQLQDADGNVKAGFFTSDISNTVILRTITNHPLTFRTNNIERMRIDSSGRMGLGTQSPSTKLHISGGSGTAFTLDGANDYSSTASIFMNQGRSEIRTTINASGGNPGGSLLFRTRNNAGSLVDAITIDSNQTVTINSAAGTNPLIVSDGGVEAMRIDSVGRLLVGTTSPGHTGADMLTVGANSSNYSGMTLRGSSLSSIYFADGTSGISQYMGYIEYNHAVDMLRFATAATEKMRIDSSGNMGLGNPNPAAGKLVITASSNGGFGGSIVLENSNNSDTDKVAIAFRPNGSATTAIGSYGEARIIGEYDSGSTNGSNNLQFWTHAGNGTVNERMRIDSAGRMGIGYDSPSTLGTGRLVIGNGTGSETLTIFSSSTTNGNIHFADGTSGQDRYRGYISYLHTNNSMSFGTNDVERMKIDGAGDVGINNSSPSSYASDGRNLVVGSGSGSNGITIASGTSNSGTIYFADGTSGASLYTGTITYNHSSNHMAFWANETERMRINNAGTVSSYAVDSPSYTMRNAASAGTSIVFIQGLYAATSTVSGGAASFYVFTNGNVQNTNNSYTGISDAKLKENIIDANSQWSDLKALQVRNYNFKEETGHQTHTQIGLVAQEVELVSSGLVYESPDRDDEGNDLGTVTKSVNYSVLYMKAVKALQEAMARIETLEQRLSDAGIA